MLFLIHNDRIIAHGTCKEDFSNAITEIVGKMLSSCCHVELLHNSGAFVDGSYLKPCNSFSEKVASIRDMLLEDYYMIRVAYNDTFSSWLRIQEYNL